MSTKTRTRNTTTATAKTTAAKATKTAAATQRPAPAPPNTPTKGRTIAEDKLWEALRANPNSTASALAGLAKIGQSTAAKILAKFAAEGSVTRTPGIGNGGRRAADMWTTADTTPDNSADDEAAQGSGTEPPQPEPVEDPKPAASSPGETTPDTAAQGGTNRKQARLKPGALHGMVEDYLRDHPDDEFGPTAIARALGGKSSGAVNNALERLVKDGTAVKTKERPKRFSLAATAN